MLVKEDPGITGISELNYFGIDISIRISSALSDFCIETQIAIAG